MQSMNGRFRSLLTSAFLLGLAVAGVSALMAEPEPAAVAKFNTYVAEVEDRLERQHLSQSGFLAPEDGKRLRKGEEMIEEVTRPGGSDLPGAMLHHWRGTAFAPGASAADFERLMKNFGAYPKIYEPQVTQARIITNRDGHFQVEMRTRQKNVITVVLDMDVDATFGRLGEQHGYSSSRSTKITEIESAGTPRERALGPEENHGFLWRLNTYWSYEARDGGLYMQIESVSLSRSVPEGLAWAVRPFVESVPRESLEFTLRSTCNALKR